MKNYIGAFRERLEPIPLFSTWRRMLVAEFLSYLALMMSNGVKIKTEISLIVRNASPIRRDRLALMEIACLAWKCCRHKRPANRLNDGASEGAQTRVRNGVLHLPCSSAIGS